MQTALYFLLFGALIFLMMRFGCGSHVMGHGGHRGHGHGRGDADAGAPGHGTHADDRALAEDTDPVCGMTVKTDSSTSSVFGGRSYYFCSTDCRDKFEASPAQYVKGTTASQERKEHRHGCH
jgi:YHS domain-containing protein